MMLLDAVISLGHIAGTINPGEEVSYFTLFGRAGLVVKIIMIGLALASVWSWAIIINKFVTFNILRNQAKRFEETFWTGRTLEELSESLATDPRDPMGRVFAAAVREWKDSRSRPSGSDADIIGARERIDRVMGLVVNRELTQTEKGLGVLAIIASAAPFIGLLGTVWGIMNTFLAIGAAGDVEFQTVLPGLAEALLATALGLLAAIPAMIFYNKFAGDVTKYAGRLEGFADELSAILSRKLGGRNGQR